MSVGRRWPDGGNAELLGAQLGPAPFCPPHIPRTLAWD